MIATSTRIHALTTRMGGTTVNTTAVQLTASPGGNSDRPRRPLSRRGRLALLIALTGAALAVSLAGAAAAGADTVPGYGSGDASVTCGSSLQIRTWMLPGLDTWADRFYFRNVTTGSGNWSSWDQVPGGSNDYRYFSPAPGTYQIYMQYAVWNGRSWVYSTGEWITQYQYIKGGQYGLYQYCYL